MSTGQVTDITGKQMPQFSTVKYVTKDGENCIATKNNDVITIQGDKNGVRQMPVQEFLQTELLQNTKQLGAQTLERTPQKDTVNFLGNEETQPKENKNSNKGLWIALGAAALATAAFIFTRGKSKKAVESAVETAAKEAEKAAKPVIETTAKEAEKAAKPVVKTTAKEAEKVAKPAVETVAKPEPKVNSPKPDVKKGVALSDKNLSDPVEDAINAEIIAESFNKANPATKGHSVVDEVLNDIGKSKDGLNFDSKVLNAEDGTQKLADDIADNIEKVVNGADDAVKGTKATVGGVADDVLHSAETNANDVLHGVESDADNIFAQMKPMEDDFVAGFDNAYEGFGSHADDLTSDILGPHEGLGSVDDIFVNSDGIGSIGSETDFFHDMF